MSGADDAVIDISRTPSRPRCRPSMQVVCRPWYSHCSPRSIAAPAGVTPVRTRLVLSILIASTFSLASPRLAEAQRYVHRPYAHGPYVRASVFIGVGFGAPVYWYNPAWFYGYPYRPFGYPWYWGSSYPPYPYYPGYLSQFDDFSVVVRLDSEPEDAEVFVDGHRAGKVECHLGIP